VIVAYGEADIAATLYSSYVPKMGGLFAYKPAFDPGSRGFHWRN